MTRPQRWSAGGRVGLLLVLAAGGCDDGPPTPRDGGADLGGVDGPVDTGPADVTVDNAPDAAAETPPGARRAVDVLFVIDNSGAMREEQAALAAAFPAFIRTLEGMPGGVPSLHIAVISSNAGAGGGAAPAGCPFGGDRGIFQAPPRCGLTGADGFLRVMDGRPTNAAGPLAETFGCLADLGAAGCGYEHHLQSLRFALHPIANEAQRRAFLRPEAALLIVILADEDDCSGEPTATFYSSAIPGQAGSLRCSLLGHVCGGQPVLAQADFRVPLTSCAPYERQPSETDTRLINVSEFVAFVKDLKGGQADAVTAAVIIGWDDNPAASYAFRAEAAPGGGSEIESERICEDAGTGAALPGIRLRAFAQSFAHHSVHSICTSDLTPAMTAIATRLGAGR